MTEAPTLSMTERRSRPVGFIRPADALAGRALAALEEMRLDDADKLLSRLEDGPGVYKAWNMLLRGMLAVRRQEFATAESLLMSSATWAWVAILDPDGARPDSARLAARALTEAGLFYRRRDNPEEALSLHEAAHRLREEYGSFEESWDSALGCAVDADLARRRDDAREWFHMAIDNGAKAEEESDTKQAQAWSALSKSLVDSGEYAEGVDAVRRSRELWRSHDIGSLSAARADLHLGNALLRWGESLYEDDGERASSILREALDCFDPTHEALLAFGPPAAADARWCLEQKEFVEKLLASLET